jgi:hypothetical protein
MFFPLSVLTVAIVFSFQLVFYVEACESGSMFDSILPDDLESMYI